MTSINSKLATSPIVSTISPKLTAAALKQKYSEAKQQNKKLKLELVFAIEQNDSLAQKEFVKKLLRSPSALFVSAVKANRKLRLENQVPMKKCFEIANSIHLGKSISEEISCRIITKKSGGYRVIHDFGLKHRTAQIAIGQVLGAYLRPRSFQFTHKGVKRAIIRAKALIKAGYVYSARLDIKDFYPSFNAKALLDVLPIPKRIAVQTVVGQYMKEMKLKGKISPYIGGMASPKIKLFHTLARQGIPMGAATSPIIGMMIISRLAWVSIHGVMIINYADDFLVLAKSPALLEKARVKLAAAVGKLPGGHFNLVVKGEGSISDEITFLGHVFSSDHGQVRVSPTPANIEAFYANLNEFEDDELLPFINGSGKKDQNVALQIGGTYYAKVRGWMSAFSACDDLEVRAGYLALHGLKEALSKLGVTEAQAKVVSKPYFSVEKKIEYLHCN